MAENFRRGIPLRVVLVAAVLAGLVLVVTLAAHAGGGKARGVPFGPEGVPILSAPPLAAAASPAPGKSVDGIGATEQVAFHTHAHLTIFVRGAARTVPPGIGIAPPLQVQQTPTGLYAAGGQCFSYLHTHAADGIIHIESPIQRVYTLGAFFDVWRQPLGRARVGDVVGPVTAFLDGHRWPGDPRAIPLHAHAQIQLDVGRPAVAPQSIVFPESL